MWLVCTAKMDLNLIRRSLLISKNIPGLLSVRFYLRGRAPEEARSLQQRLREEELKAKDPSLHFRINIGLPYYKPSRKNELQERLAWRRTVRANPTLTNGMKSPDFAIPLDKVRETWIATAGPYHIQNVADHYEIFDTLFGEAFFIPRVPLQVSYDRSDSVSVPVYYGNQVTPHEAREKPSITFKAEPDSLWTLLLTNPDGHLTEENSEYVHWFIGNIRGNDISTGEVLVDYLNPFPALGTGFQRMVFVLYKQEGIVDYSSYKKSLPCLNLKERTFRTLDFFRPLQDVLTPAGLAFYQTKWDNTVPDVYHKQLNMKEPVFEYDFPQPYYRPQQWFPKGRAFNTYLDKYRDPKEINEERLLARLKETNPFQPPAKEFKYPNAIPIDLRIPSWKRLEIQKERLKWGRYSEFAE